MTCSEFSKMYWWDLLSLCANPIIVAVLELFNSSIGGAVVGTFLGAAVGAYYIHSISERSQTRNRLRMEINSVNALMSLLIPTIYAVVAFRQQHVISSLDKHKIAKEIFLSKSSKIGVGEIEIPDAEVLTPIANNSGYIKEIAYTKTNLNASILMMINLLFSSVGDFEEAVRARNARLEDISGQGDYGLRLYKYIGEKMGGEDPDRGYESAIDSLNFYSGNVLLIVEHLLVVLGEYAVGLLKEYSNRRYFGPPPQVVSAKFKSKIHDRYLRREAFDIYVQQCRVNGE